MTREPIYRVEVSLALHLHKIANISIWLSLLLLNVQKNISQCLEFVYLAKITMTSIVDSGENVEPM